MMTAACGILKAEIPCKFIYHIQKEIRIMRLTNVKDVQKFTQVVNECEHDVYLKSQEGDVFNLKSSMSQYIAIGRLIEESGDTLELFADSKEDEARLIRFLCELDESQNG